MRYTIAMSSRIKNKSVLMMTDSHLSYLTLEKKADGFSISDHEVLELPTGMLVNAEILKADLLYKILKKLAGKIKNKNIDVILDHDLFHFADDVLDPETKKQQVKKRVKSYFKHNTKKHTWQDTHVCEFSLHQQDEKDHVFFSCLPIELQSSYTHVFEKAGFVIQSFCSSLVAFDHLLTHTKEILVVVDYDVIRVVEFKSGMYVSHKTFASSYGQFIKDIKKHLSISSEKSQEILSEHGFLRSHKDEKVYKQLIRSLSPLLQFMTQRKAKQLDYISVVFADYPLPGFVDILKKNFKVPAKHLDVLTTDTYTFQEVLSLHKNETYPYQAHIAQALKNWRI